MSREETTQEAEIRYALIILDRAARDPLTDLPHLVRSLWTLSHLAIKQLAQETKQLIHETETSDD